MSGKYVFVQNGEGENAITHGIKLSEGVNVMSGNTEITVSAYHIEQREKEMEALELWKELLSGDFFPTQSQWQGDFCMFCGNDVFSSSNYDVVEYHKPDCIYIRARALLETDK